MNIVGAPDRPLASFLGENSILRDFLFRAQAVFFAFFSSHGPPGPARFIGAARSGSFGTTQNIRPSPPARVELRSLGFQTENWSSIVRSIFGTRRNTCSSQRFAAA